MSVIEPNTDQSRPSRSGDRLGRRDRQRQQRAKLTATRARAFPWAVVVQALMAALLVAVVSVALDWLQPLELIIVPLVFLICAAAVYFLLEKLAGQASSSPQLIFGPIVCVVAGPVIAGVFAVLQQFPESAAYTDRDIAAVQSRSGELLRSGDLTAVST